MTPERVRRLTLEAIFREAVGEPEAALMPRPTSAALDRLRNSRLLVTSIA